MNEELNAERQRLEQQRAGKENWRLWGPYLSERAWGTVREDYSPGGTAWEDFDHDQARSRAYRWNEDGLGGISDEEQRLCFALALWNGQDPIIKERAFGLTGNQGNRGEDVKEHYFYVDATPSHAWMRYLYKYPQSAFPYTWLVDENKRRDRQEPPFGLLDTGAFKDSRYWDVEVVYAKAGPEQMHVQIRLSNRGSEESTVWVMPQLWFRNTWSWQESVEKPNLRAVETVPNGARWGVRAKHASLGVYHLYGRNPAETLYTENETNTKKLWNVPNASHYVKDAFDRYLVQGERGAVNPGLQGTKFGALHKLTVAAGQTAVVDLVLSAKPLTQPFAQMERLLSQRQSEATVFYDEILSDASAQDHNIMRQALAGMIWSKQFFHYDVGDWLDGDQLSSPASRKHGRNHSWRHFKAHHVISMPDKWEYPWFAAWDLAFHCAALALVDVDFAKEQLELLLDAEYLHPNGQIPAYEWSFSDVNPPVHAMATLKTFRAERVQRGRGDIDFLKRVLHKLLLNYAWWINRKDSDGQNVFEGGFLGLDNISVYDRSQPLPPGYALKQADATGWVAMFSLNITLIALEIAAEDAAYESIAIQCFIQFLAIANTVSGNTGATVPLWDERDGFFKDLLMNPDGSHQHIDVFSWVGIIPLFASEVVDQRLLKNVPRFKALVRQHQGGIFDGQIICACPQHENERGEHLFSLVDATKLARMLTRIFDSEEFMSDYGVRGVSKCHATNCDLGHIPGIGNALIEYVPGESNSDLFGGNSNWRGPVWMPTNYLLVQALEKYHRFLGDGFTFPAHCLGGKEINLREAATLLAERLVDIFRHGTDGRIPAFPVDSPHHADPHWKDLLQFNEYFHGETGLGLGAAHQTGWTGLVANLVFRRYRQDIPEFWRKRHAAKILTQDA